MRLSSVVFLLLLAASCRPAGKPVAGGDARQGAQTISRYGCGACHTIPGIPGAHGLVGPSLAGVGLRMYVAGMLPNQPDNLIQWVENPKAINVRTAMPNLGVPARDAADIAEYLYTLK